MLNVERIRDNGWRQGSIFTDDGRRSVAEVLGIDISRNSRLLVVSQDCDILHADIESEPYVEALIFNHFDDGLNGSLTYGKNPRRLHIPIINNGEIEHYECYAHQCIKIPRDMLETVTPDTVYTLGEEVLHIIRGWLAARYTRTAFPDEFNNRLAGAANLVTRRLKSMGGAISGIYIALNPHEELADGVSYNLTIYATMERDSWDKTSLRGDVEESVRVISVAINGCEGIEVEDFEVISEEDLSLADLRYLKRWDFDYLSHREMPGGAFPVHEYNDG